MNNYILMWKDSPVLTFNLEEQTINEINHKLMSLSMINKPLSIGALRIFMSSRVLQTNREYCKEILTSCNIEDQSDENICLISKGLSFRDNYWFKKQDEMASWKDVNLYKNQFSTEIAYTSLTGESSTIMIGDEIFTGELTGKGTRPKCFFRQNGHIFLAKAETPKEISAEFISHRILDVLHTPSANYIPANIYGKECSVCMLNTSEDIEMFHAGDLLDYYNCKMSSSSEYYKILMRKYPEAFLKMQVFDYITLNTDRNRNNFAIQRTNGKYTNLYPLYDHDSCFKGLSEKAIYFPTNHTFKDTINILKSYPAYKTILTDIKSLYDFMKKDGKELLEDNNFSDVYDGMMTRLEISMSYTDDVIKQKPGLQKENSMENNSDKLTQEDRIQMVENELPDFSQNDSEQPDDTILF